jgi:formylglycine-generating enzyme required for sulfatase activity
MNKQLDTLNRILAACGLVLIAIACTPQPTAAPTEAPATQPAGLTQVPIDVQPIAGTRAAWVDLSYVVFVPGGDFIMGQDEATTSDHAPAHTVTLDGFWIHQTEVTNRMYALCVELGICTAPYQETGKPYWYSLAAHGDVPVVGVDWNQAETYCEWIDGRLPTEAEWEKAARGVEADPYPWGDEQPTCDLLNYDGDCFSPARPVDVRSYTLGASPYDLADTAGNVSEWVYDLYAEGYYAVSPAINPTGPGDGDLRVVRGSDYESQVDALPVYLRAGVDPLEHQAEIGFRCVLSGETMGTPPPPVCEMPAYSPPAVDTGEIEPHFFGVTPISYCLESEEGLMSGYVNLVFDEPVEVDTYLITSTTGCVEVTQDPAHLDTLILSGPGIPLETAFTLTICPALPAPPLPITEPLCPSGYALDTITGVCRYFTPDPGAPCEAGQTWYEGYGCIWTPTDPFEQFWLLLFCALNPGYEVVELSGSPLTLACLPVDGPTDCGDDENCSLNTECLPGLTYVPDMECCATPPEVEPVCLAGYHYDPTQMLCIPWYPEQCLSVTLVIHPCRGPDISFCQNPGQYKDRSSCEAAKCRWFEPAAAAPYCVIP